MVYVKNFLSPKKKRMATIEGGSQKNLKGPLKSTEREF
jgi:hypothetical protein